MKSLYEALEIHNTLNAKLFDLNTKALLPDVRAAIIKIAEAFVEQLYIKIDILDIQLLGSNASYNYTKHSDVDIHIITNFELIDAPDELLRAFFDSKKAAFKDKYNLTIKGFDAELYVEDVKSGARSNGIYSVLNNEWVKFPEKIKAVIHDTSKEVAAWKAHIDEVCAAGDLDSIKQQLNNLYLMRKNSIAVDGEYGKGNQIFKDLRNDGFLDRLRDAIVKQQERDLTLEWLV